MLRPRQAKRLRERHALSINQVEIDGRMMASETLRHTPAGIPAFQFRLVHASRQAEAGKERTVECEIEAQAFGETAVRLAAQSTEDRLKLIGFLDRKGPRNSMPILHITEFKIIKEQ